MTTVKYDITLMVPLLHFTSNITLTAAIESVFGHERVGGRISNEKKQLILMEIKQDMKKVQFIHITGGITFKTTLA